MEKSIDGNIIESVLSDRLNKAKTEKESLKKSVEELEAKLKPLKERKEKLIAEIKQALLEDPLLGLIEARHIAASNSTSCTLLDNILTQSRNSGMQEVQRNPYVLKGKDEFTMMPCHDVEKEIERIKKLNEELKNEIERQLTDKENAAKESKAQCDAMESETLELSKYLTELRDEKAKLQSEPE